MLSKELDFNSFIIVIGNDVTVRGTRAVNVIKIASIVPIFAFEILTSFLIFPFH